MMTTHVDKQKYLFLKSSIIKLLMLLLRTYIYLFFILFVYLRYLHKLLILTSEICFEFVVVPMQNFLPYSVITMCDS